MRSAQQQTIWLESAATTFVGLCERCLEDPDDPLDALAYRAAKVAGSLRADADVGFTRCRRGHRLSIRRTSLGPLTAARR
jgi:hypothetical protein